ncbi:MAG: hypothetical protein U0V04_19585 [Spirosomataceae bacterium]|jgi:hypothetical protein
MDAALQLKIELEKGVKFSEDQILDFLHKSDLVNELTADFPEKPLPMVWRLIALSEIPFGWLLEYTQKLIEKVYENLATSYGFSLSGDQKMFLPCYNAMITSALCRLDRANDPEVRNALDWINSHQPMQRGEKVELPGFNFEKYGGCFNKTPCYIGLAKSVFALNNYKEKSGDSKYDEKLNLGTKYLLEHSFYKRLSNGKPITNHITDISFPESYQLNVVELLRFASSKGLQNHPKTQDLIEFVKNKQTKNGIWKCTFRYKGDGYVAFDKVGKGEWITFFIQNILKNTPKNLFGFEK